MRIIPVVDLLGGQVVRGVGGRRHEYRPIQSELCDGPAPAAVGRGLVGRLGVREAYVADLDAIAGAEPAWEVYGELAGCGLRLWVDAGVSTVARGMSLARFQAGDQPLAAVIAGLESLPHPGLVEEMLSAVGPGRLVFSLDLREGLPLSGAAAWRGLDAEQIAELVLAMGVRRMIVLDLARVGTRAGVGSLALCRRLRKAEPALELIAGGGVRHAGDLESLAEAGCDAALVASALHDGRLTRADLAALSPPE